MPKVVTPQPMIPSVPTLPEPRPIPNTLPPSPVERLPALPLLDPPPLPEIPGQSSSSQQTWPPILTEVYNNSRFRTPSPVEQVSTWRSPSDLPPNPVPVETTPRALPPIQGEPLVPIAETPPVFSPPSAKPTLPIPTPPLPAPAPSPAAKPMPNDLPIQWNKAEKN
jgi:hypothetical protein